MNIEKLKKIDEITKQRIEDKRLVSACYAICQNNEKIYENAFGYADIENQIPLGPDTEMRLASMTKPIT
ncbi:MAG: serine hydrolase, partial [Clostridia bacterium]|nr:serine hydrolase [Clostridia bacterium]